MLGRSGIDSLNLKHWIIIIIIIIDLLILTHSKKLENSLKLISILNNSSDNNRELEFNIETASIQGFRIEKVSSGNHHYNNNGISTILADSTATIRLIGIRITSFTILRFVTEKGQRGSDCNSLTSTKQFNLIEIRYDTALSIIQLPPLDVGEDVYYICVKEKNKDGPWIHQGTELWMQITTYQKLLPLWSQIILILILLSLSGLFSGLNLGLMSIDRTDMKIIAATGTEKERRFAKTIQPLRDNGNYLLCTLLLGNVLVNSSLTILLDDLSSGIIAVIGSTISIVIFGEIVPQAICSRHGLAIGARTAWLTKIFMALTFPLSYPISFILDKILGKEIGNVYNRERLKELIKVTDDYNDLERDEVNIIAGALELRHKTVSDIMTRLDSVFMLPSNALLDFDTVSEIMSQGYSRVPIYEGCRHHVISVLYTKDLAFVDGDDKMPLRTICDFYSTPIMYVYETTTLDVVFRDFKTGNRGHMAFAQKVTQPENDSDPIFEITGIVTLEDVIETLIQAEIKDETDVYSSIRRRRSKVEFGVMGSPHLGNKWLGHNVHVSPQIILAAFQYLSTAVDEFNDQRISKTILHRLLNQNVFFQIKVKGREYMEKDTSPIIYEKGKPIDYFVLILEGRVQVQMGKENLEFDSGPFSFFGIQILNQQHSGNGDSIASIGSEGKNVFNSSSTIDTTPTTPTTPTPTTTLISDYTVRPITDITFLKISKSIYLASLQATLLEKTLTNHPSGQDQFTIDHHEIMSENEKKGNNSGKGSNWTLKAGPTKKYIPRRDSIDFMTSNQNTFPQTTNDKMRRTSDTLSNILLNHLQNKTKQNIIDNHQTNLHTTQQNNENYPKPIQQNSMDSIQHF